MEIPYVVHPRKDTGLTNSKIAIWLFLASEVMLFGGLFSAYVYLRVDAGDPVGGYPWPERALPVLPGLINTFVLIASSVAVVFAWQALKLRNWFRFQVYMWLTILAAAVFMTLKSVEYNIKFHHQAVEMKDGAVLEGHLGYEKKEGSETEDLLDRHGKKIEENRILVKATALTFDTVRFYTPWVEEFLAEAKQSNAKIALADDVKLVVKKGGQPELVAAKGAELSVDLLKKISDAQLIVRTHNSNEKIAAGRVAWDEAYAQNPGKKSWQLADTVNVDPAKLDLWVEQPKVRFTVTPAAEFAFEPRKIRIGGAESTLQDATVVTGEYLKEASSMGLHYVDALDFRKLVQYAKHKGLDPDLEIEKSWILSHNPTAKAAWEWHKGEIAKLEKHLREKYGVERETGLAKRVPTITERYRVEWKDFAAFAEKKARTEREKVPTFKEEIFGPDYEARAKVHAFPSHVEIPRDLVAYESKFTPSWNNFYAIYFTITGLHGLHVIGGALVLAYYAVFGRKMYVSNPEWLANRVEVAGLFWHFVDLVWIFLFPLLYLM